MANRYKVTLTQAERERLDQMARNGKTTSRKFVHARALLLCDAGEFGKPWKVAAVADALGISTRTIEHIKERFVEEGIDAALERKRAKKTRTPTFDGAFDARLAKLACSPAPEGRARWTLRLLGEKLVELKLVESVSTMTVQRSLKKTNCALT
jgi:transposase